ncbi:MAG: stage II sporulation protein M [Chloroflexi bacterium]|nr:stage II sporulation protein M [Chloroflexota bacterium]
MLGRRGDWARLEALLARAGAGNLRRLEAEELEELGRLYRRLTSDLALAQRDYPGDRLTGYLNQLAARAHAQVYRTEASGWPRVWAFLLVDFPRLYRRRLPFILAALALFALPGLAAFLFAALDPAAGEALVAPQLVAFLKRGQLWTDIPGPLRPFASSLIMANNLQVAFFAFAGGILAGVGTVYVLLQNGLLLGAVAGLAHAYGLSGPLLAFVAPHGAIELSVVLIAGGAGLRLGWALLRPGLLSRRAALAEGGREAVQLLLGCVPLLVLAGALEGFVSPSTLPAEAKLGLGLTSGLALYAYLCLFGRRS